MNEKGPGRKEGGREALLVNLAKELELKPGTFLSLDPQLQRSSTLSVMAAIALSSPSPQLEERMRRIWLAGLDAGVLKPEDAKDIF